MRYESSSGEVCFYYELDGKQDGMLFVVLFSYGSAKDEATDFQFNKETIRCDSFEKMQAEIEKLKKYCLSLGYKKVKATKRNVQ